jgi:RNA polymerase-binding protein DksA
MARHLDLSKFQRLLEEERARVLDEIKGIQALDGTDSQSGEASELADYDQHQADAATETFLRERDVALQDDAHAILRQVEVALKKIEAGTYGTCERCGKIIQAARLEAIPYTPYCIECAQLLSGL